MKLAIGYSHTPWVDARRASMARLMAQVDEGRADGGGFTRWEERCFNERMPTHVWTDLMWRWANEQRAALSLFLQDDVILAPRFFRILHAIACAIPPHTVIAFHVPMPRARDAFREGERWARSRDGLVGIAYAMGPDALQSFLAWKAQNLKPRAEEWTTEDSLIDAWCLDAEVPVLHPLPGLVDHDLSIASTYGNEQHTERRPVCTWRDLDLLDPRDLEDPLTWNFEIRKSDPVADLGRFFPKSHWVARLVLKDEKRGQEIAMTHERAPFAMSAWVYP